MTERSELELDPELVDPQGASPLLRRRLAELERFRALLDQSNEAIFLLEVPSGRVVDVNASAGRYLGYEREALLELSVEDVLPPELSDLVYALFQEERAVNAESGTLSTVLRTSKGGVVPVEMTVRIVALSDAAYAVLVARDVSARVRIEQLRQEAEAALRESEARYKSIVELAPDGIVTLNLLGVVTSCNSAFVRLSGFSRDQIVGKHFTQLPTLRLSELARSSKMSQFVNLFFSIVRGQVSRPVEFRWRRQDGAIRWGEARLSVMRRKGTPTAVQAIIRDITERKWSVRLLQVLNQVSLAMAPAMTPEAIFNAVADAFDELGFSCIVFLRDKPMNVLYLRYFTFGEDTVRAVEHLLDGRLEDVRIPVDAEGFRQVVEARETLYVEDMGGILLRALPDEMQPLVRQVMRALKLPTSINAPLIVEDGVVGLLSVQADTLRESDVPRITAFAHQVAATLRKAELYAQAQQEIAERKRAEAEILRLQHLLQSIADSMPSVLIALDPEGCVLTWNPATEALTGRAAADVMGERLWETCEKLTRYRELVEQVLREGRVAHQHKESVVIEGKQRYRNVSAFPLVANRLEGVVLRIDDVTQQVYLEDLMLQSAKMASVGGLAAGVAHELNNPLGAMMQGAQMVQILLDGSQAQTCARLRACGVDPEALARYIEARDLNAYLDGIRDAGRRAGKIVTDLLSFSRKAVSHARPHNLNTLVEKALGLAATDYDLKRQYDFRDIEIVRELTPDLPDLVCDGVQIQQVVLNLVCNAAQAMAEKKRADPAYRPRLVLCTSQIGTWLRLEVENNGPPIPKDVHERLFEPFFTTKAVGEGTGLGLWVSWSIVVKRHGGRIWVEPLGDDGVRFVLELPLEPPAPSASPVP